MKYLFVFLMLFVAQVQAASLFPGSVMESNGVVVKPGNFWAKAATNDPAFAAAVQEVAPGSGGAPALGYEPQFGTVNLTNWSAITPASKQNASANLASWSGLSPSAKQNADANLTAWAEFVPGDKQDSSVVLDAWSLLLPASKQDASANLDAWSALAASAKQNADADLDDLADGTLSAPKIDSAIARNAEVAATYDTIASVNTKDAALQAALQAAYLAADAVLLQAKADSTNTVRLLTQMGGTNGSGALVLSVGALTTNQVSTGINTNHEYGAVTNITRRWSDRTEGLSLTVTGLRTNWTAWTNGPMTFSDTTNTGVQTVNGTVRATAFKAIAGGTGFTLRNTADTQDRVRFADFSGSSSYMSLDQDTAVIQAGAATDSYFERASAGNWRSRGGLIAGTFMNPTNGVQLPPLLSLPASALVANSNYYTIYNLTNYGVVIQRTNIAGAGLQETNQILMVNLADRRLNTDFIVSAVGYAQLTAIPTNSIGASIAGVTNWYRMNLTNTINGGGMMEVATNYTKANSFIFIKPTYTLTETP